MDSIFTPEEIDEMREASKGIGMAGAGVAPFVDQLVGGESEGFRPFRPLAHERFEAGSRRVRLFYCGGTTLVGQAQ